VPLAEARSDERLAAIQHLLRQHASEWEDRGPKPIRGAITKEAKAAYRRLG
jgi:hypothetical protein